MESNSTSRNSNTNNDLKLSSHHQHVEFGYKGEREMQTFYNIFM